MVEGIVTPHECKGKAFVFYLSDTSCMLRAAKVGEGGKAAKYLC